MSLFSCSSISVSQGGGFTNCKRTHWDQTFSVYSFAVGKSSGLYIQIVSLLPSSQPPSPHRLKGEHAAQCFPTYLIPVLLFSQPLSLFINVCLSESPCWTSIHQSFSLIMNPKLVFPSIWLSLHSVVSLGLVRIWEQHCHLSLSETAFAAHLPLWFKLQINAIMQRISVWLHEHYITEYFPVIK